MTYQGESFSNLTRYIRLVGKLIYLTFTRLHLSFKISIVSRFTQAPCIDHWNVVICII